MIAHRGRVPRRRVDTGTDRRRAHVDLSYERLGFAQTLDVLEYRVPERRELLSECHRHRVLQLRASHLYEWRELLALRQKGRGQLTHGVPQMLDRRVQRELHGSRIDVVR